MHNRVQGHIAIGITESIAHAFLWETEQPILCMIAQEL